MFGFLMTLVAAGIGVWIGASHDWTLVPQTFTIAGAGLDSLATVSLGIRRFGQPAVLGTMSTTRGSYLR